MLDPIFYDYVIKLFQLYTVAFILLKKDKFDGFTRIISTFNAIHCVYFVYNQLYYNPNWFKIFGSADEEATYSLLLFSSYLFVDGIYQLYDVIFDLVYSKSMNVTVLSSIIHHFVGGYGIYLIGSTRMGTGIGMYFAFTELSTPFLNISWLLHRNRIENVLSYLNFLIFFLCFIVCRILSIPVLTFYIYLASEKIDLLIPHHRYMIYFGCTALSVLNCVWFNFVLDKFKNKTYKVINTFTNQ